MTASADARQLAAFLRALAEHLDAHPHLAPFGFGIHWPTAETSLHADGHGADPIRAWARTLGATEITAHWVTDKQLNAQVEGVIGGFRVRVWCVAPELADEIDRDGLTVLPVEVAS